MQTPILLCALRDLADMNNHQDLQQFINYAKSLRPNLMWHVGNELCLGYPDRKTTRQVMKVFEELHLPERGHSLTLRGGGSLYGYSPLPQNRGILQLEPTAMLAATHRNVVSLDAMIRDLQPSNHLFSLMLELQGQKSIFIYRNDRDAGYPCVAALPSITPARLNQPIDKYVGAPLLAIDSKIARLRQLHIEDAFTAYENQKNDLIPPRIEYTSTYHWSSHHWVLDHRVWYEPDDNVFVVTAEDPRNSDGHWQQQFFMRMVKREEAEPTPLLKV